MVKISVKKEKVATGTGFKQLYTVRLNNASPIAEFKSKKEADSLAGKLRRRL